ncbi:MAG: hypothetical protein JWP69_1980 [Flaviaesturariibacter sp.]|nr:hypothetical protein [Flaviaesturariibacter sp.]
MKYALFLLLLFAANSSWAQDTAFVIVHKDPRVDALVKKQAAINAAVKKATSRTGRGYRLLVANTKNRQEAIDAKTKLYNLFPELKAYLAYQSPYFKLKAGNFQTRSEAESYQKLMNSMFPKGVFIVNDVIEIKAETDRVEVLDDPKP